MTLTMTAATTPRSASLHLAGELDYQSTGGFIDTVDALIGRRPAPEDLHLDLSELTFCDSAGLSGLLLVHRRTSQAGVRLHLEHRPRFLDRILDITGTFEHLVTSNAPGETGVR
ncbi:anti-sigma factor antagonist [Mycobacterium saskatchewanense]|uniref:Anti-anti-sigma factor n=1 Tax=Mycobacterium saskatchewanense TaxID=220927 RepID=A0AAJ3NSY9_9MYCO|nr:STAS domain-containing protein [Mycobacterium saskatchewanense]ORW74443.1 anti-anti-sigma factor [Mycobacterium saskatchewanense]BBX61919.1 anti-sigma factor antagonist [Mycobacterium saskatchewanense]